MSFVLDSLNRLAPKQLQQLALHIAATGNLTTALQLIELATWQNLDNPDRLWLWGRLLDQATS